MDRRTRCGGFTYIGLIVLLAILGLVGAAGMKTGSLMQRAAAEQELLEIGAAFSEALRSYAAATPKGQPQQPPNIEALLKDPRFPQVRRHLRKIFVDPLTGKAEWGVTTLDGKGGVAGVTGVYSLSAAKPLKVGNFDARFVNFDNKQRISEWKFTAAGQGLVTLKAAGEPVPPSAPVAPPAVAGPSPAPDGAATPEAAAAPEAQPPPAADTEDEAEEEEKDLDAPKPVAN